MAIETRLVRQIILAGTAIGALAAASPALAGGFAIREQSTTSQGTSFAGDAVSGELSSMFWNSAGAAAKDGTNSESVYTLIVPNAKLTAEPGSTYYGVPGVAQSAEIGELALVPSSYFNYQMKGIDPHLYFGLAFNAPFGLVTKPDNLTWAGANEARTTSLKTYNLNPVLAYKIAPGISIGVGAQIEYAEGTFKFATSTASSDSTYFSGTGWAGGFTAGIEIDPSPDTHFGLGWRSAMTQRLDGNFATNPITGIPALFTNGVSARSDLNLPDIVTFSVKQSVTPQLRALGTFEWSHWTKFTQLQVVATGSGYTVLNPGGVSNGGVIATLPANWHDGYFLSGGLEWDAMKSLTLRAGVGYEWSPVQDPSERFPGIPDANRTWLSIGAGTQIIPGWTADIAYSHLFVSDASLVRINPTGAITLDASLDASIDIVSASLKTKW